jgi:hypothetical protein
MAGEQAAIDCLKVRMRAIDPDLSGTTPVQNFSFGSTDF